MSVQSLGAGSYGAVFRSPDKETAVKFFTEDGFLTNIREINIMQHLRGHPLFTQLIDVLPSSLCEEKYGIPPPTQHLDGKPYADSCIAMKCVEKSGSRFTQEDIPFILLDLLLACEFLIHKKIHHRDVSVGNVLITWDHNLKRNKAIISDFGTSVFSNHTPERDVTTCGFVPPEMSKDTKFVVVTQTHDMFSAAAVVFRLIVGKSFHEKTTWATHKTQESINSFRDERLEKINDGFVREVLRDCLGHFSSRLSVKEVIDKHFLPHSKFQCHIRVMRKHLNAEPSILKISGYCVDQDWSITQQSSRLREAYSRYEKKLVLPQEIETLALKFIASMMLRHHTAKCLGAFIGQHGVLVRSSALRKAVFSVSESVNYLIQ